MNVKYVQIQSIKPYDKNPRKNDNAVDSVAESISEFGWKKPIVVDVNGVIASGHVLYKAAKRLNMKEVPVLVADDLTDEQVKAYRLADNKTGEIAEWDFELLKAELEEINEIDMDDFGFELEQAVSYIDSLLESDFVERNSEPKYFDVTFTFEAKDRPVVEDYLKENGKKELVEAMLKIMRGKENA